MVYYKKFDSGLRLIVKRIEGLMSVTAGIMVGVGSYDEDDKINGISHFIEHVNFKGTNKRTAFDISENADRIGAQLNAYTSKDMTCYHIKSTSEHIGESFEILSDLFVDSIYPEYELEKEKDVIVEEINMDEDTPDELVFDVLANAHFGNAGYGRNILGSIKNVKSFTREDIFNYKSKHYTADNTVVSFAGNISVEEAESLVLKYLEGKLSANRRVDSVCPSTIKFEKSNRDKDIEQVHIALAYNGVKYTDEKVNEINVLNTVLGGGMSSRLYQTVREKQGLCYSVFSFPNAYRFAGSLIVYVAVNPKKIETATESVLNEISVLKRDKISIEEFERAKEQIKSTLILGQESTSAQMNLYGKYALFTDNVFDFEKRIDEINKLSLKNVNDFLDSFDFDNYSKAVVGKGVSKINK